MNFIEFCCFHLSDLQVKCLLYIYGFPYPFPFPKTFRLGFLGTYLSFRKHVCHEGRSFPYRIAGGGPWEMTILGRRNHRFCQEGGPPESSHKWSYGVPINSRTFNEYIAGFIALLIGLIGLIILFISGRCPPCVYFFGFELVKRTRFMERTGVEWWWWKHWCTCRLEWMDGSSGLVVVVRWAITSSFTGYFWLYRGWSAN